ncbi:MAG: N-acetylmuramoyl-L-alanine amidase [Eubacterium sp.]|nr:N-acetylmuramoyl-L-alanine amidase [Eubacterium sp.]
MGYTNSSLVAYRKLSPNHSGQRKHGIDRISPHCVVGQCTAEGLGDWFAKTATQASSNYGIDRDGRVGLYVEEKNRSWCTSSNTNDQRAVTIECASGTSEPYEMNGKVYVSLVELCTDICRRNGKKKLLWFADKSKSLNYEPESDEMVITVHRWFANKSCPGDWLYARLGDLAEKVTAKLGGGVTGMTEAKYYRVRKRLADAASQLGAYTVLENAKDMADKNQGYTVFDWNGKAVYGAGVSDGAGDGMTNADCPFMVKVSIPDLIIRKGTGTNMAKTGKYTGVGCFTITEVRAGKGSDKGWGKLKSGAGWISLDYCEKE